MRVIPPTSTTSAMSLASTPASLSAFLHGSIVRSIRSSTSFSRSARLIVSTRGSGVVVPASLWGGCGGAPSLGGGEEGLFDPGRPPRRQLDLRLLGGFFEPLKREPVGAKV